MPSGNTPEEREQEQKQAQDTAQQGQGQSPASPQNVGNAFDIDPNIKDAHEKI